MCQQIKFGKMKNNCIVIFPNHILEAKYGNYLNKKKTKKKDLYK